MATLSEHTSDLTATFIDVLLASECQQRNDEEHCKTSKTPTEISLFTNKFMGHVTKAAGIEVF